MTQHCKPQPSHPSVPAPPFRYYRTANSLSGSLARSKGETEREGGGEAEGVGVQSAVGVVVGVVDPIHFVPTAFPCDAGGMLCGLLGIIVRISILKRLLDLENPPKGGRIKWRSIWTKEHFNKQRLSVSAKYDLARFTQSA